MEQVSAKYLGKSLVGYQVQLLVQNDKDIKVESLNFTTRQAAKSYQRLVNKSHVAYRPAEMIDTFVKTEPSKLFDVKLKS